MKKKVFGIVILLFLSVWVGLLIYDNGKSRILGKGESFLVSIQHGGVIYNNAPGEGIEEDQAKQIMELISHFSYKNSGTRHFTSESDDIEIVILDSKNDTAKHIHLNRSIRWEACLDESERSLAAKAPKYYIEFVGNNSGEEYAIIEGEELYEAIKEIMKFKAMPS